MSNEIAKNNRVDTHLLKHNYLDQNKGNSPIRVFQMDSLVKLKAEISNKKQNSANNKNISIKSQPELNKLKLKKNKKSKNFDSRHSDRQMGVGYYALSQQESTRQQQLQDLEELRNKTEEMQNTKNTKLLKRQSERLSRMHRIKQLQNK